MADVNKYIKHKLFVTMPDGIKRWVQVRHNMTAQWNMVIPNKYSKGKHCLGWVEQADGEWFFHFKDTKHHVDYMNHYVMKRETFADRSSVAIAERAIEYNRLWREKQKEYA
jgi:hypothetical protein